MSLFSTTQCLVPLSFSLEKENTNCQREDETARPIGRVGWRSAVVYMPIKAMKI